MGRAFIAIVGALVARSAWILRRNPASAPNATNRLDLELNLLPPVHRMHQRQQAQRPVQAIWSRPGSSSSRRQWGRLLLMLFFVDSILWTEAEVAAYLFQPYRYCVFDSPNILAVFSSNFDFQPCPLPSMISLPITHSHGCAGGPGFKNFGGSWIGGASLRGNGLPACKPVEMRKPHCPQKSSTILAILLVSKVLLESIKIQQ